MIDGPDEKLGIAPALNVLANETGDMNGDVAGVGRPLLQGHIYFLLVLMWPA